MAPPIHITLDRGLVLRAASRPYAGLVGRSAFEFVPPAYHDNLHAVRRELFERRRFVSCELPIASTHNDAARWWLARAAPICEAGRAVAAVAHAVPRGYLMPAGRRSVNREAWERELALRDLLPILTPFNAQVLSALGAGERLAHVDA